MSSPTHQLLMLLLITLTTQYWLTGHTTSALPTKGSATHSLLKNLTNNYPEMGKFVVPRQEEEPVLVNVSIHLLRIIEVDRDKQSVHFRTLNAFRWRDDFLSWDPEQFRGLTRIHLPVGNMWTPDISIHDVVSEKCTHGEGGAVSNVGGVHIVPSCINEIRCRIDITYFPFDKQTCTYNMGSWMHTNRTLVIENFKISKAEEAVFEWEIDSITADLHTFVSDNGIGYPVATITFLIHHKAPLFAFLLILPAALLSVMTSAVFLLPSCNESKIEIGLSIFLSFMVLLNILMDVTPGSSSGVPYLGYYFTVNSLLIAMSVFCSTIVLRIYGKSATHKNMSPRLKTLTLFMAKVLRMKTERKPTDVKGLDDLTPAVRMVDTTPDKCTPNNEWILLASVLDRFFFLIYIVINVTATLVIFIRSTNGSAMHSLLKKLTKNYPETGNFVVPRQQLEPVRVNVSIRLMRIIEVDRDKQSVSFRTWNTFRWRDDFLTWDPDQFQGLNHIPLPVDKMWTPDIAIFDVVSEECTHGEAGRVSERGEVHIVPSCINEIRCHIDITYFPFDKQTCFYRMGSWIHDSQTLIIEDFNISTIEEAIFEWEIDNITSKVDDSGIGYPVVYITFKIHHKAPLFAFLLILPSALLSVMTSVVFLLPSSNENKIEIGLSIFLSFLVLLNILMDATPGSSTVPLIGYYFTVNSLLIAMSVFCSTIVLRIYEKSVSGKNMSPRLKALTLFMAKIARMKTERKQAAVKGLDDLTPAVKTVDTTPDKCTHKNDWVLLACVLDRFFFFIYIVINVTATLVVIIRYREDTHG